MSGLPILPSQILAKFRSPLTEVLSPANVTIAKLALLISRSNLGRVYSLTNASSGSNAFSGMCVVDTPITSPVLRPVNMVSVSLFATRTDCLQYGRALCRERRGQDG